MPAEMWDLTNVDGAPVGRTIGRNEQLPAGFFHVVAQVCVMDADRRILVTQRSATKDDPFAWEIPGGAALSGESSLQAAARELREEVGLDLPFDEYRWVGQCVAGRALLALYLVRIGEEPSILLDHVEVAAAEWVALPEVRRRCDDGSMSRVSRLDSLWTELVRVASD